MPVHGKTQLSQENLMCLDGGWFSDEVKNLSSGAFVVKTFGDSFNFPFSLSMDPLKYNTLSSKVMPTCNFTPEKLKVLLNPHLLENERVQF